MSIISETLRLRSEGPRKGFIPFVTAGDLDMDTSLKIITSLAENGADVIELGVPFSDPMADGPTIQASSQRALANGMTLNGVLHLVERFRESHSTPIVLFSYLNPLLQYGFERLADDAAKSGVDGVLITDAIDEDAAQFSAILKSRGLDLISLIAPTTTEKRLAATCSAASGFVYAVSRSGVTGARTTASDDARTLVERSRKYTDLPIAVGFGVSTADQINEVWQYADAAVVGSAIVSEIAANKPSDAAEAVKRFVRTLLPEFANKGSEI